MSKPSAKGNRRACFTIWAVKGWTPERLDAWLDTVNTVDLSLLEPITYIIAQHERGKKSAEEDSKKWEEHKGHHIQGYVEFSKQVKWDTVKAIFECSHVSFRPAKGTAAQNKDYCHKSDTWVAGSTRVERGQPKEQGRRTDLEAMARKITERGEEAILDIADERPDLIVRYHKGFKELAILKNPPKEREEPTILYFCGPPGCGKSRLAHKLYPDAYTANDKKEGWFDNYRGEKVIIFDEFEGNYPIREMLRLLDWNPLQLPVKGSHVAIRADTFIFTSNHSPDVLYQGSGQGPWLDRINNFGAIYDEEALKVMYKHQFNEEPGRKPKKRRDKDLAYSLYQTAINKNTYPELEEELPEPPKLKRSKAVICTCDPEGAQDPDCALHANE